MELFPVRPERRALAEAACRVFHKMCQLRKQGLVEYGKTCAPRPSDYVEDDPTIGPLCENYLDLINPENAEIDRLIHEELAKISIAPETLAPLPPEKVWVWGGPTPSWGGSMRDDTLVRGADYFSAKNVVYVYGATDDKMLSMLDKYDNVLCQVNENCRTPGALAGTPQENAALLSELALRYSNIRGAMLDDVSTGFTRIIPADKFDGIKAALVSRKADLRLYGVVYAHELARVDFTPLNSSLDVVNLWFWSKDEILDFDMYFKLFRKQFPDKKVLCGVFLHEYGISDAGNPPELLRFQIKKIQQLVKSGDAEGMVILGDREIKKWPASAAAVRDYLAQYRA